MDNQSTHLTTIKISGFIDEFYLLKTELEPLKNYKIPKKETINLLPMLDPYIMGYKERGRYLEDQYYNYVFDRSGNATNSILLNGRICGIWDVSDKSGPMMRFLLFENIGDDVKKVILKNAKILGKFITEKEVKVKECNSMVQLPKRTAGGFMSPLKDC